MKNYISLTNFQSCDCCRLHFQINLHISLVCFLGPPAGTHQIRTFSINQRLLEPPYLEQFRRKSLPQLNNSTSSNQSSTASALEVGKYECQGYKPNAPQIQGKDLYYYYLYIIITEINHI